MIKLFRWGKYLLKDIKTNPAVVKITLGIPDTVELLMTFTVIDENFMFKTPKANSHKVSHVLLHLYL